MQLKITMILEALHVHTTSCASGCGQDVKFVVLYCYIIMLIIVEKNVLRSVPIALSS